MSTRTYTLSFLGASTLTLPGGVFFYVKSAAAALTIRTRGSTTSPIEFTNVGAGLRFGPVPADKRWTYLDVTSAVVQTVEVVVSDDAEVDIASTVSVAGNVTVSDLPATAATFFARTTLATATSADIAANAARRRITIYNWSAGGGSLTIRDTGATTDAGAELQPGTSIELAFTGALRIRNNSGVSLDYSYIEES